MATKKVEVSILGRGQEQLSVEAADTISDLRNVLALDQDVQAFDEQGNRIADTTRASTVQKVHFQPNIAGGYQ